MGAEVPKPEQTEVSCWDWTAWGRSWALPGGRGSWSFQTWRTSVRINTFKRGKEGQDTCGVCSGWNKPSCQSTLIQIYIRITHAVSFPGNDIQGIPGKLDYCSKEGVSGQKSTETLSWFFCSLKTCILSRYKYSAGRFSLSTPINAS